MSGSINLPGFAQQAAAASYSKGQDVTRDSANDKAENARALRKLLFKAQESKKTQQTNDTQKGILA